MGRSTVRLKLDGKEVWRRNYPFLKPPEMQQIVLDMSQMLVDDSSEIHFGIEEADDERS